MSAPILEDGDLNGFYVGWDGNRKYPVDMASFAVNLKHFIKVSYLALNRGLFMNLRIESTTK